jgi:septum formation protein
VSLPPVILASASPRRADLLGRLGLSFSVRPARVAERLVTGEPPEHGAHRIALEKATAVARDLDAGLVIAADTLVVLGDRVFGKPAHRDQARDYLLRLSGRDHRVLTGVAVVDVAAGREAAGTAVSRVRFLPLHEADLDWYLGTDEWRDKAGAYGLQGAGAWLVEKVEGCPSNVIGLPPHLVRGLLEEIGRPLSSLLATARRDSRAGGES